MEKIKAKLNKIKDEIEVCEERRTVARNGLIDAEARYEAAESEKASFKRRFLLLQQDVEKMKERVREKQDKLNSLESKTAKDESIVKELENQEVEGDEKLESLGDMVKRGQLQAEDFDLQFREAKRKLHVLIKDIERAEVRYETNSLKVEDCTDKLRKLEARIKSLEAKEYDQSEKDTENEEKVAFLREQQKEALVRAENAERDAFRLDRVNEGILVDIENWNNKRNDILDEMKSVSSLADDI